MQKLTIADDADFIDEDNESLNQKRRSRSGRRRKSKIDLSWKARKDREFSVSSPLQNLVTLILFVILLAAILQWLPSFISASIRHEMSAGKNVKEIGSDVRSSEHVDIPTPLSVAEDINNPSPNPPSWRASNEESLLELIQSLDAGKTANDADSNKPIQKAGAQTGFSAVPIRLGGAAEAVDVTPETPTTNSKSTASS